ncbi:Smr/MutS family protein [Halopseudomonas sp.]|uniref:Smr/MutS family protein n=1 Tax=Halopseudomonas sp. TaxID=2901191 RepID=UPI0030011E29
MSQDNVEPDDENLFRQAIKGVKPLKHQQADTGKPKTDRARIAASRARALNSATSIVIDGLSDQFVIDVAPEEELMWGANGVQASQLRKLKAAQIPFDGSIDLHGMTVERARELLWAFLAEAVKQEIRCVRVTHGKAQRKDGRTPILKSHVNTWLRQHASVLAFTSCIPRHGGTGSVYVLLKRNMLEGRED